MLCAADAAAVDDRLRPRRDGQTRLEHMTKSPTLRETLPSLPATAARSRSVRAGSELRKFPAVVAVVLVSASCGGDAAGRSANATPSAGEAARAVVMSYLRALHDGDGARACRLLSPTAMQDGGYRSFAACARVHRHMRSLARYKVVRVELQSARRAYAFINDADISDSGDDALPVTRYGRRWLLDAD
jgi:hypothetical protein